ncbi:MAG: PdaC/SigV domain-containing protein [Caulobacteraceae bacterium]
MKTQIALPLLIALVAAPAWAGSYSKDQKTAAYELSLTIPDVPAAIAPLKAEILRRFEAATKSFKADAVADRQDDPQRFQPYLFDSEWRVTFDSPRVISLSGLSVTDEGGAHPSNDYDTIVWDKRAARAVALPELFVRADLHAALDAIAEHAKASLRRKFPHEEGQPADYDPVEGNIAADPAKLGQYALTYAKGQTKANGIVLLWAAGAPWPNVMSDIKLSIPVAVFRRYLAPRWAAEFN